MKTDERFVDRLREWSHRPTAVPAADAAAHVAARLRPQVPAPRAGPLRPLMVAAAALAMVVAALLLLRSPAPQPTIPAGTTAAIVLSSGTQLVIDLGEVRP